jgi:hypothetical protein
VLPLLLVCDSSYQAVCHHVCGLTCHLSDCIIREFFFLYFICLWLHNYLVKYLSGCGMSSWAIARLMAVKCEQVNV